MELTGGKSEPGKVLLLFFSAAECFFLINKKSSAIIAELILKLCFTKFQKILTDVYLPPF
jgi:hypothetical protein